MDTLKPKYNSIDLTEVELPEMDAGMNSQAHHPKEEEDTNMLLDVLIIHIPNYF